MIDQQKSITNYVNNMRSDIIKTIVDLKEIDNIIILTYNIDLMFLQSMLLPKLKKCGHPNLLIFADINRATETFQSQHQWVQGIGSRYRLVPVSMEQHGSFHPKAILLTSEEQATLLVGSGNLSFAGWRENGEIWIKYHTEDVSEKPAFSAFHQYLGRIIDTIPLNKSITAAVEKAYSGKWSENLPSPDILIGRMKNQSPLIDRIFENINLTDLERVTICTPFFDSGGEAIRDIFSRASEPPMRILVQNQKTNLTHHAIHDLPKIISILPVDYINHDSDHHSFLHSKFYAFEKKDVVDIYTGSANCSRAALKTSGKTGNAELLTKITLTKDEYDELFLRELEFLDTELDLSGEPDQEENEKAVNSIKILAVRQSGGQVRIAYSLPESYMISACYINNKKHEFSNIDETHISVKVTFNPHRVFIEASHEDQTLRSPVCWVDDEIELQISARDRKLANTIDTRIKYGEWNIGGWIEIMRLIHSNLDYESSLHNSRLQSPEKNDDNAQKRFKYDDIFSDDFNLLTKHNHIHIISEHKRLQGFQQMLLSWFGVGWKSDFYDEKPDNDNDDDNDNPDENGDKPEKIKSISQSHKPLKKEDKKRALRVASRIVKKLTDPKFIESRPPSLLGIDLSIIGTLLCSGLCEGWLENKGFYELSYDVWHPFFFDANIESGKHGWIEILHDKSDNPLEYINDFSSIELSSILFMWALAAQSTKQTDNKILFLLGCITSIARTSWIWSIEDLNNITPKLRQNLLNIKMISNNDTNILNEMDNSLRQLLQWGIACKKLFDYLKSVKISELRDKINISELSKGETLWQGDRHGLCILNETSDPNSGISVSVLSLNNPNQALSFKSNYLLPVKELLGVNVIPPSVLAEKERKHIMKLFNEISQNMKFNEK